MISREWKDLDIDNLPDKFFTREDLIIERFSTEEDEAYTDQWRLALGDSLEIITCLLDGTLKYRYKTKPLLPICITVAVLRDLLVLAESTTASREIITKAYLEQHYDRDIEVID